MKRTNNEVEPLTVSNITQTLLAWQHKPVSACRVYILIYSGSHEASSLRCVNRFHKQKEALTNIHLERPFRGILNLYYLKF